MEEKPPKTTACRVHCAILLIVATAVLQFAALMFLDNAEPNSHWWSYQLSDSVQISPADTKWDEYFTKYPGSVAALYRPRDGPPIVTPDIARLSRVVEEHTRPSNTTLVVHLRVGDVLRVNPNAWTNCSTKKHAYALCKDYYDALDLPKNITEVVVVSNAVHRSDKKSDRLSKRYLDHVMTYLHARLQVPVRHRGQHYSPDFDFDYMCAATYFVQGGGGFSDLVAQVVRYRGGVVVHDRYVV